MGYAERIWKTRQDYASVCIQEHACFDYSPEARTSALVRFRQSYPDCDEVFEEAWQEHLDFLDYVTRAPA